VFSSYYSRKADIKITLSKTLETEKIPKILDTSVSIYQKSKQITKSELVSPELSLSTSIPRPATLEKQITEIIESSIVLQSPMPSPSATKSPTKSIEPEWVLTSLPTPVKQFQPIPSVDKLYITTGPTVHETPGVRPDKATTMSPFPSYVSLDSTLKMISIETFSPTKSILKSFLSSKIYKISVQPTPSFRTAAAESLARHTPLITPSFQNSTSLLFLRPSSFDSTGASPTHKSSTLFRSVEYFVKSLGTKLVKDFKLGVSSSFQSISEFMLPSSSSPLSLSKSLTQSKLRLIPVPAAVPTLASVTPTPSTFHFDLSFFRFKFPSHKFYNPLYNIYSISAVTVNRTTFITAIISNIIPRFSCSKTFYGF
jgi:hypothetical protein